MEARKPNWPALGRTAFLIDHASAPKYIPHYCAEAAQLISMLAASLQQHDISGGHDVRKK